MPQLHLASAATAADPYPYYAALVAEHPMHRDADAGLWVAASARAVEAVLATPSLRVRPPAEVIPATIAGTPVGDLFGRLVRMTDGLAQAVLKDAVHGAFDPLNMRDLAAASERCARLLGDGLANDPAAIDAFLFRLPPLAIADLLGFEEPLRSAAVDWTQRIVRAFAPGAAADDVARGSAATESFRAALAALAASSAPDESLFTSFLDAGRTRGVEGDVLIANTIGFFSQSHDATAGLMGNTLVTLGDVPGELRERAARDRALLGDVVAETARFDAPVQNTRRFAAADANVMGSVVRAGEVVLVLLAAANRDPDANADPNRFEPQRNDRRTYTFGAGAHACPGAQIATTIATAGVAQLLRAGVDPATVRVAGYHRSLNVRIPMFAVR